MSLKAIKVSGYRGFSTPQTIRFAQPSGKPGSGLTLIVGPNNAGKSSVMEVLSYLRNPGDAVEFIEGQKNTQTNGRIRIEYHTSEG
ncbi:MAG: ATP-binding protein, partial [Nitrospira sp.]|nr:ATP-binding protein [Nitrospira sp.]